MSDVTADLHELTLDEALKVLLSIDPHLSVMLSSSPGVGKTDIVHRLGSVTNAEISKVELTLRDQVDIIGLPTPRGETTEYLPFGWAMALTKPDGPPAVLFLDDFGLASQQVQNAALSILLDRVIGQGEKIRDNVRVIGATNRVQDRTGVEEMPPTVKNRMIHLPVKADLDCWVNWAMDHDIDPLVISFLRKTQVNLNNFDPNCPNDGQATPRSWTMASRVYRSLAKEGKRLQLMALSGTIGTGMASTFMAYTNIANQLMSPEEILIAPNAVELPSADAVDVHMANITALEAYVTKNIDTFKKGLQYAMRIPPEFGVMFFGRIYRTLQEKLAPADYAEAVTCKEVSQALEKWGDLIAA